MKTASSALAPFSAAWAEYCSDKLMWKDALHSKIAAQRRLPRAQCCARGQVLSQELWLSKNRSVSMILVLEATADTPIMNAIYCTGEQIRISP
jgi:hypothetical protein